MRNIIIALVLIGLLCFSVIAQSSDVENFASTLLAAPSTEKRQELLVEKKDLVTPELRKALIRQGNTHLMAGRYATAFDVYDLAQKIAQEIGDKEGVASASLDIGTVYYFQANYPAAIEHYKKARELFIEVTNNYESAKALSGLALIYKEQRRDAEALTTLEQALKEFRSLGDKEEIGNTLNSIGTIYYGQGNYAAAADAFLKSVEANGSSDNTVRLADSLYMQGEYSQSLTYYKESLNKLNGRAEPASLIAALNGAANSAYYQGNYEEALQYYQRNVPIQEAMGDKLGVATSFKGIGNVHRVRGEYPAALDSYYKALAISEQLKAATGQIQGSIGLTRAHQGNYEAALQSYRTALAEFEKNANKIDAARALSLIGNVYFAQGDYEAALSSYRRALTIREETDDKAGQGDILAGMGTTFLRQRNYPEALDSYETALKLFDSLGHKERMTDILTRVAETFIAQGEYSKGLNAAESSTTLAKQLDNQELLWFAQMLTGRAQRGLDHPADAERAFNASIATVESLRTQPPGVGESDHSSNLPYLSIIDLLMNQHRPGEAFDFAERAKAQFVIEMLRNSNAIPAKGLSTQEQEDERRLIGEAASLDMQLDRETQLRSSNEARRSKLRDRLQQAQKAYADFRQKLFAAHPQLKVERGEANPLSVEEMSTLIDAQTALIEYTVTERNVYLFALTLDPVSVKRGSTRKPTLGLNLKVYPLDLSNNDLVSKIREFEHQLESRGPEFSHASRELYDLLLKPADAQLLLKTKLIVVPDGVLWRLPFEALAQADDFYLIDQMQVSYAPTICALREMRQTKRPVLRSKPTLVAFGNPQLSDDFIKRFELGYPGVKLTSAAQSDGYLKQIGTIYGTTEISVATEERFKSDIAKAGILHVDAPGLLDEVSPLSSFIALGRGDVKQSDGFLQAREIMNLQTDARLVVLPKMQQTNSFTGSGMLANAWAWFVAGPTDTLVSRWDVDAAARSQFVNGFYSRMKFGTRAPVSSAAAVRQSMLQLRHSTEYHHPYYWAGFALVGN
ncbi:MAG TPA: tetratricopeptide repeat protein [Pyrinomonadaceae bacterium]